MSLVPERDAFKEEHRGLISEEVLYGKLSASSTEEESQNNSRAESLVRRELSSACPISLVPERIEEFKQLYSKRFGRQIDEHEADEKARQLLRLMEIIYMPMRRDELAMVEDRNNHLGIVRGPAVNLSV